MHSFDNLPLAFWTSIVGAANATVDRDDNDDDHDCASCRSRLREAEWAMRDRDARMMRRAKTRNAIEARILELRSARGSRHGGLLPSMDKFTAYLDGADGWLFLDECNDATPEEMESRWDDDQSRTEEICTVYYAAERKYMLEKDQEMEEGARAAAAKRAAAEGGGSADSEGNNNNDHDTQQLPIKHRMETSSQE